MTWTAAMELALNEAHAAAAETGDVPVGAILLDQDLMAIESGRNHREFDGDATAHAELVAIRKATKSQKNWNLEGFTLVVTLEPCAMCAGAIRASRISRVVFGAWDEIAGASGSVYDILRDPRLGKPVEVISGVMADECSEILSAFFKNRRDGNL